MLGMGPRLLGILLVAGCNGAVTLEVTSDRPIPQGLDTICVGIADRSTGGGHFGRAYRLEGKLATLPQTLRVDPGGADGALAWVRGDRGGVPVQRAAANLDFGGDVTLSLDRCVKGPAALPHAVGAPVGPAGARLAASEGQGGAIVLAVASGQLALLEASGGRLVARDAKGLAPPPGNPVALVTADLDGDCDDDAVIATDGAPPEVWLRERDTFVDGGPLGNAAMAALATADVDGDGATDVIAGGGGTLQVWRNDGAGHFTADGGALSGAGIVTAVSALATGDLDGDGRPDLVVGQAGGPLEAWFDSGGGFVPAPGAVPGRTLDAERLTMADTDGDLSPDLLVSVRGGSPVLFVDRVGLLEDQTAIRLPAATPATHAIAIGGWDDGCEQDAVLAADAGAPTWHGSPGGVFVPEADMVPAATDVVMIDLDADGVLDAVLATAAGAQWLAR